MNFAVDKDINNFLKGYVLYGNGNEDPTYLGFRFVFNFTPTFRDFGTHMTLDPLFVTGDNSELESAERYLRANAYPKRAAMLAEFRRLLSYINGFTPWYWQKIEGLGDLWKYETTGDAFTPFRGKEKVITVSCLESIDLRITALADLYRKATFDPQNMRNLLPKNLRYFTLKVQLAEMNSFHKLSSAAKDVPFNATIINQNANLSDIGKNYQSNYTTVNNLVSVLEFDLSQCEFDFSESFPVDGGSVDNTKSNVMSQQRFKIKVGKIREINSYKLLDLVLGEGPNENRFIVNNLKDNLSGRPNEFNMPDFDAAVNRRNPNQSINLINGYVSDIRRQVENIGANLVGRQVNRLNEAINSKILGNVYGDLRNQTLESIISSFGKKAPDITQFDDIYPNVPGSEQLLGPVKTIGNIYKHDN